jgi:serine/threonine protein kinase
MYSSLLSYSVRQEEKKQFDKNDNRMIQKLGCGGFGKVYLIRNRATREYCAAKHQKWTSTDIPKLVRREVTILKKLSGRQVSP